MHLCYYLHGGMQNEDWLEGWGWRGQNTTSYLNTTYGFCFLPALALPCCAGSLPQASPSEEVTK